MPKNDKGKANGAGSGGGASGALSYVAALSASFAFVSLAWAAPATNELPTFGQVVQGAASMSQTANQMTINQSTQRAIINWQSFSIGAGARVQVNQLNSQSVLLNRVVGQSPSQIFGQLSANGHVILQNPNGVLFGKDGSVNAASFTATTLGISDANFMAGNMLYERNGSTAGIVNEGTITVAPGGYVALLGASVSNEGKIDSKGGNVFLAAADTIKVPVSSTGRIKLELTAADMNTNVSNSGSIITQGGQVYMQALALNRAAAQIIQSGSIDTTGEQGGAVNILADGGLIRVSGSINANSTQANNKGGDIIIGRDEVSGQLAASTDVSGAHLVSKGGFVETSGHDLKVDDAQVKAANWLLDPDNIDITGDASAATAGYSKIKASAIAAALNAGTSVTVSTTAASALNQPGYSDTAGTGAGTAVTGDGNILVNAAIVKSGSSDASLTLLADNGITVNQRIGKASGDTTSTGKLDVAMTSGGVASVTGTSLGMTLNNVIDANGGTVSLSGTTSNATQNGVTFANGSGISAATYTVTGTNTSTTGGSAGSAQAAGVLFRGTTGLTSTTGASTVTGDTRNTSGYGVMFYPGASTLNAGTGSLVVGTASTSVVGIRSGWGGSTINTKGNVTIGSKNNDKSDLMIQGVINAQSGALTLLGKSSTTNGIGLWDGGGQVPKILATNGASITMNGESTKAGSFGVILAVANKAEISSDTGAISITGTSSGSTGIYTQNNTSITSSSGGNITLIGNATGSGGGVGLNLTSGTVTTTGQVQLNGTAVTNLGVLNNATVSGGSVVVTGLASSTGGGISTGGTITATAGNVTLNGTSGGANSGVYSSAAIASNTGDVNITGTSVTGGGVTLQGTVTAQNNVNINGTSSSTASTAQGVVIQNAVTSNAGDITVTGNTNSNVQRAVAITANGANNGSLQTVAAGKTININADTLFINTLSSVNAGASGTVNIQTTSGNRIELGGSGDTVNSTAGNRILNLDQGELNRITAGKLIVGSTTGGNVRVAGGVTTADATGDLTLRTGGNIDIANNLTVGTNGGKNLTLEAAGTSSMVTQAAALKASGLELLGSGAVYALTHIGNDTVTLAGNIKSLSYFDANSVAVGTVVNSGLTAAETVKIESDADISVLQQLVTADRTSAAIILNAGKSTAAGTASGGNVSFSGSGGVSVGAGGRATLLTGSVTGSTGLGIAAGNHRYNSDEVATNYTSVLGSGTYAVYREAPSLSVSVNNVSKTYDGTAFTGGNGFTESGATGLKNGDTLINAVSSATWGGSAQNAVNAAAYTLTASESVTGKSALGYVTTYSAGTLTVHKKDVTLASITAANKIYNGNDTASITSGSLTTGVGTETLLISGTGIFSSKNAADGKTVTVSDVTALTKTNGTGDWNNYNLTTTGAMTTTANIAKKDVTLTSITAANKAYDGNDTASITAGSITTGVGSETLLVSGVGRFSDKNAADGKTVTVSDVTALSKANGTGDWDNYNLITTGAMTTTANIAKKDVTLDSITAANKTYNGSDVATITSGSVNTGVGTETLLISGTGTFSDKNAGINKLVTVADVGTLTKTNGTGDWNNYNLTTSGAKTAYATIDKATLSAALTGTVEKVYDGTTAASNLVNANFAVTGWGLGEGASVTQTAASYTSKNVSDNNGSGVVSAVLSASDFTAAAGTLLSNYELPTTAVGHVGKITPAPLVVKVNDSSAFVTLNASQAVDNGLSYTGFVNGETAGNALTGVGTRTYLHGSLTPVAGTYTQAFGWSSTPTAVNGNYDVTVQKGTLTVVPADKLLISIAGKTETYGVLTAANAGASASNVTAQYCLNANCTGTLVDLTVTRLPDGSWQATDATNTSVTFSTLIDSAGKISTGGYVNVGNYSYDASNTLPPSGANFNGRAVNGGVLTVEAKAVTLDASSVSKTYDGSAALAGRSVDITNAMSGDLVSAASSGGSFSSKNAGTHSFTMTGLSLSGADRGNYSIANSFSGTTGHIDTKALTLTAGSISKTYDGQTGYSVTQADLDALSLQLLSGDRVTAAQLAFATKNVSRAGNGMVLSDKTVTLDSVTLNDGNGGANYSLTLQGNQTSTITPKSLQAAGAVADKVYDGTRQAVLGDLSGSGVVAGDAVIFQASSALFDDKNVLRDGNGNVLSRNVIVSGLSLTGSDAVNYSLSATAFNTTARILPKQLSVRGTSVANKRQDGLTQATLTMGVLEGLVGVETLDVTATASFASASAGNGKPVSISYSLFNGLNGGLASNYELADQVVLANILGSSSGANPAQSLVMPARAAASSKVTAVSASASLGTVPQPAMESRDECSSLTPDDCQCEASALAGVDICMVPYKLTHGARGLVLGRGASTD